MTTALSHLPSPRGQVARWAQDDDARTPWQERAACRGVGIDLFFPVGSTGPAADEIRRARQICAGCPVRQQCLDYALASGQQYGIWGGLDEQERRRLRQQLRKRGPGSVQAGDAGRHDGAQTGSGRC
jgi:WhiB family redox-sensing transcriptional regulator